MPEATITTAAKLFKKSLPSVREEVRYLLAGNRPPYAEIYFDSAL